MVNRSRIAFSSQQAAEKYLKALLSWRQVVFPKTHDLDEILNLVETTDPDLAQSLRDIVVLSPYGVELRYPGDRPDATWQDAEEAVKLADRVRAGIMDHLRTHP
jgi:HEPN domain-containing protein